MKTQRIRGSNWKLFALKPASFLEEIVLLLCLTAPELAQAAPAINTDLAIGKSASATNCVVRNTVQFDIGMTNLGSVAASNISGSDIMPAGFVVVSWTSSGSPSVPAYNPANGNWTLAALSAGSTASVTISTIATNAGSYTNTALLTAATPPDTNSSGGAASVVVTVAPTPPGTNAVLMDEFDLNGNLNDSLGNGSLTANSGVVGAGFNPYWLAVNSFKIATRP